MLDGLELLGKDFLFRIQAAPPECHPIAARYLVSRSPKRETDQDSGI
jgi:hypothetical protein